MVGGGTDIGKKKWIIGLWCVSSPLHFLLPCFALTEHTYPGSHCRKPFSVLCSAALSGVTENGKLSLCVFCSKFWRSPKAEWSLYIIAQNEGNVKKENETFWSIHHFCDKFTLNLFRYKCPKAQIFRYFFPCEVSDNRIQIIKHDLLITIIIMLHFKIFRKSWRLISKNRNDR